MNLSVPMLELQQTLAQSAAGAAGMAGLPPLQAAPHEVASFEQMMQRGVLAPPEPHGSRAGSLASQLVLSEDEALQTVSNDALYMLNNANQMTFNEIAASSMQMQIETTSLQVDMSMKISVVESSKGALETLMKNQ
ncbi:MAG TPA: type III secretion protein HrpB2 [Paraburkholderia sp.]|nr:type III secretion protein HrpB2 [Paraburkholderia sp.]